MSDQPHFQIQALPDGKAKVILTLDLQWEDIAALGREASRLAAQTQRPASLNDAVVQKLSAWPAASAASTAQAVQAAQAKHRAEPGAQPASVKETAVPDAALNGSPRVSSLTGRAQQDQTRATG